MWLGICKTVQREFAVTYKETAQTFRRERGALPVPPPWAVFLPTSVLFLSNNCQWQIDYRSDVFAMQLITTAKLRQCQATNQHCFTHTYTDNFSYYVDCESKVTRHRLGPGLHIIVTNNSFKKSATQTSNCHHHLRQWSTFRNNSRHSVTCHSVNAATMSTGFINTSQKFLCRRFVVLYCKKLPQVHVHFSSLTTQTILFQYTALMGSYVLVVD